MSDSASFVVARFLFFFLFPLFSIPNASNNFGATNPFEHIISLGSDQRRAQRSRPLAVLLS